MKLLVNINRQDYSDFNRFHFIQTKLKRALIIKLLVLIIMLVVVNREQFDLSLTIILTIVFIITWVLLINRSLNQTKNIPDDRGSILGEKEMEFTDEQIVYKTQNSQGTSEWNSIKNLRESSTAFYLYADTNMAIILPKRDFKDSNEIEEFKKLVSRKINTT